MGMCWMHSPSKGQSGELNPGTLPSGIHSRAWYNPCRFLIVSRTAFREVKEENAGNYIVGIYARLSRDDERAGESVSIENQKEMLSHYVREQGWTLYDYYCDDGVSGTTFDRPGLNRLVQDATDHKINLVLCKTYRASVEIHRSGQVHRLCVSVPRLPFHRVE